MNTKLRRSDEVDQFFYSNGQNSLKFCDIKIEIKPFK